MTTIREEEEEGGGGGGGGGEGEGEGEEEEMLTALDRRLHQLEVFPTPSHPFPSPHHLGNTETSIISWEAYEEVLA